MLFNDAAAETGAMSGAAAEPAFELEETAAGAASLLGAAADAAVLSGAAAVRARGIVIAAVVAALSCKGKEEVDWRVVWPLSVTAFTSPSVDDSAGGLERASATTLALPCI